MFLQKLNTQIEDVEHKYQAYIAHLNHLMQSYDKQHQNEIKKRQQWKLQREQKKRDYEMRLGQEKERQKREVELRRRREIEQQLLKQQQEEASATTNTQQTHSSRTTTSRTTTSRPTLHRTSSSSSVDKRPSSRSSRSSAKGSSSKTSSYERISASKPTTSRKRFIAGVGGATSSSVYGSFQPPESSARATGKRQVPLSKRKTISSQQKEAASEQPKSQKLSLDEILKQAKMMKQNLAEPSAGETAVEQDAQEHTSKKSNLTTQNDESQEQKTSRSPDPTPQTQLPPPPPDLDEEPPKETSPIIQFQTHNMRYQEASQLMMRSMHSFLKSMHSSLLPSAQDVNPESFKLRSDLMLLLGMKDYYESHGAQMTEQQLHDAESYLDDMEDGDSFCNEHERTCMEIMFGDLAEEAKVRCERKTQKFDTQTHKMTDFSLIKWIPSEISADIDTILQPPPSVLTEEGTKMKIIIREPNPVINRLILPYHSKKELKRLYELRHLIQFVILQEYVEVNVARAYMRHFQKLHPQSKDFLWLYRLVDSILLREGGQTCSFVPRKARHRAVAADEEQQ